MKKTIIYSLLSVVLIGSTLVYAQSVEQVSVTDSAQTVISTTRSSDSGLRCSSPGLSLRLGDGSRNRRSEGVKKLQTILIDRGHLFGVATGYFGTLTLSAVKKFQAEEGLNTTGYVGPLTLEKIKNRCEEPALVCDYASAPEGCTYIPGPSYNKRTQCGLVISCGSTTPTNTGYTPPSNCQAWNDGCNVCSRQSADSPAMCTLRACIGAYMMQPMCNQYFDTTKICTALGKVYTEGQSTSCIDASNGQVACIADATHVCRSGAWKIEGGLPIARPTNPIACTMEARLCSDGTMMPRDNGCVWHPEQCSR